jgi:hypothetical protein
MLVAAMTISEALERANRIWGAGIVTVVRMRPDRGADVQIKPGRHLASDTRGRNYVAHRLDANGRTACHEDCKTLEDERCR